MASTGRRAGSLARLELRPLEGSHAAFVESLYAHAEVTRSLLRIQRPLSSRQAREFCEPPPGEYRFVAVLRATGSPIGTGNIGPRGEAASIGYSVLPAYWRRGFGTELASLLVEFARERLRAVEVRATTLADNVASARILLKLGFAVADAAAREVDSRGDERRVVRWSLRTGA